MENKNKEYDSAVKLLHDSLIRNERKKRKNECKYCGKNRNWCVC